MDTYMFRRSYCIPTINESVSAQTLLCMQQVLRLICNVSQMHVLLLIAFVWLSLFTLQALCS
jgi:hypothetical protein